MDIEQQVFFLLNYGQGYDDRGVRSMPVYTRHWHVNQLSDKLRKEAEARAEAMKGR